MQDSKRAVFIARKRTAIDRGSSYGLLGISIPRRYTLTSIESCCRTVNSVKLDV